MNTQVDTFIFSNWILPMDSKDSVLLDHGLAIRDGRIVAILPKNELYQRYSAKETIDLPDHVLLPGFVNAHTHAAMVLFRSMANDLPLQRWLEHYIWPTELACVTPEFIRDGGRLAMAEMIKSGTTCFHDQYFYPEVMAEIVESAGMRANIGIPLIDFENAWMKTPQEALAKGIQLWQRYIDHPMIDIDFAPHAPYSVSNATLCAMRELAHQYDIPIHMHVHETEKEIVDSLAQYQQRPLRRLYELGLLSSTFQCVHMTQVEQNDVDILQRTGASVVHCPESNLKLASGFCPITKLINAGINVALGTDGAASNNDLDMLGETKMAALLAKGITGDATACSAWTALKLATINGAVALGRSDQIGSLTVGKSADVISINLAALNTQPIYDVPVQVVYAANQSQIDNVWIAGKHVLDNRALTTLDETAILDRAHYWKQCFDESIKE